LWVEANRNAAEVVKPLEDALIDGEDPIQGMVAGGVSRMREAEEALRASEWAGSASASRPSTWGATCRSWTCCRGRLEGPGHRAAGGAAGRGPRETMAIGDNWNDVDMLEWAGQGVMMGNAALELRAMAKMRGWKQAPPCDEDGVAAVLEVIVARALPLKCKVETNSGEILRAWAFLWTTLAVKEDFWSICSQFADLRCRSGGPGHLDSVCLGRRAHHPAQWL
jgi:hypothetical protein